MTLNAYRTLRISLAAVVAMLLLFADIGFAAQTYKVRTGDTIYSIASKHGVSVTALQRSNSLKSSAIKKGLALSIPSNQRASSEPVVYGVSSKGALDVESSGKVFASIAKGDRFTVLAREGSKFNVKLASGVTGWVKADAVDLEDSRKPIAMSDTWGMKRGVVQMALAFRGARYVRGGEGSGGFDCSGFVKYLYSKLGVKLPHSSRAQYGYGTSVAKENLKSGDILFFVNTYRRGISHVGLYMGDGKFIHAATTRNGVMVSKLTDAYYSSRYLGAKRVQ